METPGPQPWRGVVPRRAGPPGKEGATETEGEVAEHNGGGGEPQTTPKSHQHLMMASLSYFAHLSLTTTNFLSRSSQYQGQVQISLGLGGK